MNYMAQVRHHLAESREQRIPFEQAWQLAMEALPNPGKQYGYSDGCMAYARRMFEKAYYGRELPGPDMRAVCAMFEEGTDDRPMASHVPGVAA